MDSKRLATPQLALSTARDLYVRLSESRYTTAFARLTVNALPLSDDRDDIFKVV
jgi:hypothetical protein